MTEAPIKASRKGGGSPPSHPVAASPRSAYSSPITRGARESDEPPIKSLADSWYAAAMEIYRQQNPHIGRESLEYASAATSIYDVYCGGHKALQDQVPQEKISASEALAAVEQSLGMTASEAAGVNGALSAAFNETVKHKAIVLGAFMQIRLQQPDCRPQ
jgi:hypothetical protein